MSDSRLRIIVIHPELLGTYGDGGNALVLAHRAKARGIQSEILQISHEEIIPDSGDIYLIGGGEDRAQTTSAEALIKNRASLSRALNNGARIFAVCAGFQLLGEEFPGSDGMVKGVELLPITSRPAAPHEKRIVGEIAVQSDLLGVLLTGFENHRGRTILRGVPPLGFTKLGVGNGDEGVAVDGAIYEGIVATYMHGPALARNPELADYLLGSGLAPFDEAIAADFALERRNNARKLAFL